MTFYHLFTNPILLTNTTVDLEKSLIVCLKMKDIQITVKVLSRNKAFFIINLHVIILISNHCFHSPKSNIIFLCLKITLDFNIFLQKQKPIKRPFNFLITSNCLFKEHIKFYMLFSFVVKFQ